MRYSWGWSALPEAAEFCLSRGVASTCGSREHAVSNFWQIPRFIISWMPAAVGGGQQINRINSVCRVLAAIKVPPSAPFTHSLLYPLFARLLRAQGWPKINIIFIFSGQNWLEGWDFVLRLTLFSCLIPACFLPPNHIYFDLASLFTILV